MSEDQLRFEEALRKLPDYMMQNLVDYIESGKDFHYMYMGMAIAGS